jgi:hypothetical protein
MKALITDSASLSAVGPLELVAYLRSQGWRQSQEVPGRWSAWTRPAEGSDFFEIAVPLSKTFRDFASRISDALQVLEAFEHRSQLQILRDVLVTGSDVIRLRLMDADLADATVPLEEGASFIMKAKDLLLSAASAVVSPRSYYARRKPSKATDYMRRARLGQTEPGSFIVTILSPVSPSLSDIQGSDSDPLDDPFERKVTKTLAMALNSAHAAAQEAAISGSVESFVNALDKGVSANFCDALAGMATFAQSSRSLEIGFSWSRSRPIHPSDGVPSKILLSEDVFPLIREAATYLKERTPREDFEIEGVVVKLDRQEADSRGRATIRAQIDDVLRRVVVDLDEADYSMATEAHRDRRIVTCSGTLVHERVSFRLENPRGFTINRDEDEET